ncbi:DUF1326 domain-containing protein [Rhodococcus sp. NPDC049939]|uniref:DUF1326 domain-containing protein n=1 Tax=Rhodococcus sp. NPDC049939 TaxID=3155511 RepID=UPI0034050D94
MSTTEQRTRWALKGHAYEFCNCVPGCTCYFSGFPSSADGSCQNLLCLDIRQGSCGDVNLTGVKSVVVLDFPRAIHEGGGKTVLIVDPDATEEQVDTLHQIITGAFGGAPWTFLAGTYEVIGRARAPISFEGTGVKATMTAEGFGRATGDSLKDPVTGEDHQVQIVLPEGPILRKGECGVGSFEIEVEGLHYGYADTNCIAFEFEWSND